MAVHPNILSICTGGSGLDLGVRLACEGACTVCYVEREAFAVANLVATIQAGLMDDAPVWSDLTTFDGTAWRGTVDWLIGGIPCQPHSNVGPRTGETDERNLWPDTARIIREVHPRIILLENVEGFKTFYWERVRPELQAMGYSTREGLFSAREVGASQRRRRLFALAYTDSIGWAEGEQESRVRNNNGSTSSQAVRSRSQMADKPWGELTPSGGLFPPREDDFAEWTRVLGCNPEVKPWICRVDDGLAARVDIFAARTHINRMLGN